MNRPLEQHSATVPSGATQAEELRARWAWTEPSVWTNRMLTALEAGVKGGQWFSLIDKVYTTANLEAAYRKVASNGGAAGVDHQTIARYAEHLETNLENLCQRLREGSYRPQAVRRVYIPKPGSSDKRPLGIPTVQDRVVQAAVRHVLEPIFERDFAEHSYGFRPGRGCKDALRRVDALLKAGYHYVVDADLKGYFDTIPHDKLVHRIREKISDGKMLTLLESFLKQGVLDGLCTWTPERGSPQGAVISPLLSNIYLDPLDHVIAAEGMEMVRYADDFVILCRSPEEAQRALARVQAWTAAAGLTLHPEKTRVVDVREEGFDFLGYHFIRHRRWPRRKSLQKFKEAIRVKTHRTNGRSLTAIIADVNRTMRGWFEYFKHGYRPTYPTLDGWIRMRLRCILRKRAGQRGRGHIADHLRWPNRFFAERGLFSLTTAHALACQSSRR